MNKQPRILIVDDEPANIFLFEGVLEKEGYLVSTAKDGEEALTLMDKKPPDLVILDLLMPRKHGFDLLAELKGSEKFKHIPVIIATAVYRGPVVKMEVRNMGADAFLEKPVEPEALVEVVKKFVQPQGLIL